MFSRDLVIVEGLAEFYICHVGQRHCVMVHWKIRYRQEVRAWDCFQVLVDASCPLVSYGASPFQWGKTPVPSKHQNVSGKNTHKNQFQSKPCLLAVAKMLLYFAGGGRVIHIFLCSHDGAQLLAVPTALLSILHYWIDDCT